MKEITYEWLAPDQFRIIKQIIIVGDRRGNDVELGRIFYKRLFTNAYNLKKQGAEDDKSKNPLEKFLGEYPKQENFPSDEADALIFAAVRREFPKSATRSDVMFHSLDIEKLDRFKNRQKFPTAIYFYPDFSLVPDIYDMPAIKRIGFKADLNIYSYYSLEIVQPPVFHGLFDLNDRIVEQKLKTVEFE